MYSNSRGFGDPYEPWNTKPLWCPGYAPPTHPCWLASHIFTSTNCRRSSLCPPSLRRCSVHRSPSPPFPLARLSVLLPLFLPRLLVRLRIILRRRLIAAVAPLGAPKVKVVIVGRVSSSSTPLVTNWTNDSTNRAIWDDRPSLAMTHMWHHNACFHNNAWLTLWCTLMAYFVLPRNREEFFNKLLSLDPNPDHLRRGLSHGYNTSCVSKIR